MFQPRIRSAGETNPHVICCSAEGALCPTCQTHFERPAPRAASLRTAEKFLPPDPYAAGIARLQQADAQAAAARTWPTPRSTEMRLDQNGVPDPYAAALEQMRKEQR